MDRRYKECICCKRLWNVSALQQFPGGIYVCPDCVEREKVPEALRYCGNCCFLLGAVFGAVFVMAAAVLYADRPPCCRGHPGKIIPVARSHICTGKERAPYGLSELACQNPDQYGHKGD